MSMRMASFLAGFGGGYLKSSRQATEDERQAKMDKITTDRAQRETEDWDKKQNYEKGLAAAGAPVKAEQANDVLKDDDGNDMPAVPAFRTNDGQRFTSMADATATAEKANTPEAVSARQSAYMQSQGKPLDAIQMQAAATSLKLNQLGLKEAEVTAATNAKNSQFMDYSKSLGVGPAAAKMITETKIPGFDGIEAKHEVSADGKTQTIYSTDKDGTKRTLFAVPAGEAGDLQITQRILTMKPETTVQWHRDSLKQQQDQSNWEKTFQQQDDHFKINKALQEKQIGLTAGHLMLAKADDARKQALFDNESKVPAAVSKAYDALKKRAEIMDTQIYKAQAEGTFKDGDPGSVKLMDDRAKLTADMNKLLNPYINAAQEKLPGAKGSAPPPSLDAAIRGEVAPAQKPNTPAQTNKPSVSMQKVAPVAAPTAPIRTVDGGKTWTLDVPKTIPDPSVKWYREIPNPAYAAMGNKSFASADEAKAAFSALQK
jgi:hypothetical protein